VGKGARCADWGRVRGECVCVVGLSIAGIIPMKKTLINTGTEKNPSKRRSKAVG